MTTPHGLTRWQARRLSRQFAGVGVGITAARLRAIAAGAPADAAERADVEFAYVASELRHDERIARLKRGKRQCMNCLVIAGVCVLLLVSMVCMVVLMFSLMLHTPPF